MVSKEELIQFEKEIEDLFLDRKILSPIHLSKGNEDELIEVFKRYKINKSDWVFSTHRSHHHALLKGIPREWLKQEILENRSIHIYNKEHNFFTSAIVGGNCPIAVGTALAIQRRSSHERVFVFVGDMASRTGLFDESVRWSGFKNLPIYWIIEDNEFSTNTPTIDVWGPNILRTDNITGYKYKRGYPHVGVGKWIVF